MSACSVLIDSTLAELFAALQAKLTVQFPQNAVNDILEDLEYDQVSGKHYLLYERKGIFTAWRIEASVSEYEPET